MNEEEEEVINKQARDLLNNLQTSGSNLCVIKAPVSESMASLDLKLSLGGSYSFENLKGKCLPRFLSSSPSANGMLLVRTNGSEVLNDGAQWLPDHSPAGTMGSLKRSLSLSFTGNQEPKREIWNAITKRRIDSTRRFLMQRKERRNSQIEQQQDLAPGKEADNRLKKEKSHRNGFEDNGLNLMKMMPSVVTTDDAGCRVVEGILYKYTREKVSIVCICHGAFHSPEGFVSHSGKMDTSNPMNRIKVMYDENYGW